MEILKELKELFKVKGITNITEKTKFKDLNIDSLDLMQIVIDAEEKFKVKIDDDKLTKIETVKQLIDEIKNSK